MYGLHLHPDVEGLKGGKVEYAGGMGEILLAEEKLGYLTAKILQQDCKALPV